MKFYWLSLICLGFFTVPVTAISADRGVTTGSVSYSIPDWFKESFLEINEDSKEAEKNNKHVVLFMHLEGCPYCSRMLDENFRSGNAKNYIQNNFDVLAINILGDREVVWDENTTYIEKTFARELKVHFTPTIVFLNSDGQAVLQLNGYRKPAAFMQALNYVKDRKYLEISFSDYVRDLKKPLYSFKSHQLFTTATDFSNIKGPMLVLFEDESCAGCDEFHNKVLQHKDVLDELGKFKVIRLDANSNDAIVDNDGNKTTPAQWSKKLNMDYRPGSVLFDNGYEVTRADGRLYHFHYKELLRYVSSSLYFEYATYNQYLNARQKQLLNSGVKIDYGE